MRALARDVASRGVFIARRSSSIGAVATTTTTMRQCRGVVHLVSGCATPTVPTTMTTRGGGGRRVVDGCDGWRAYSALVGREKGKRAGAYGMGDSILGKRDGGKAQQGGRAGAGASPAESAAVREGDELSGDVSSTAVRDSNASSEATTSAYDYMLPVRAYYVGSTIDVRGLAKQLPAYPKEFNREGVIIRMSPKMKESPNLDGDAPIPPEMLSRYLVVFKFGSVVFYNMGHREREECLKLARSFTSTPLAVPMTDDYRVVVRPTLEDWASLESDHIVLKRMDINNISVISSVLAQTVALEHYEQKVDGMVEIFSKLNKSTELTGDLNISKKRLFSLVAENNNTLTELITKLGLLGRSDTAWQYAQYNIVWEGLRQDFELEDRFQDLDYKLNLIQTQVKFYLEILQNRKSDALEWIIIVLISLEICVSLYDMSDKMPSIPWM